MTGNYLLCHDDAVMSPTTCCNKRCFDCQYFTYTRTIQKEDICIIFCHFATEFCN